MKPDWLDSKEYPFQSQYLNLPAGKMHYIDEGAGDDVIVMIHGTPSWSFIYRNLIKKLSGKHRCVAMDHLGFGLSDKPEDFSYKPEDHALNFEQLMEHLQLKDITLVVHDFGAPIGFSYAIRHPQNVKNIVMLNTWMWSLTSHKEPNKFSKFLIGPLGKFLHQRYNNTTEGLIDEAFEEQGIFSKELREQYVQAIGNPDDQVKTWRCARELVGVTQWYKELWQQRQKIQDIPTLILWGVKDKFVKKDVLHRWKKFFHECFVIEFENSGHFLQEENADEIATYIDNFVEEEKQKA